MSVLDRKRFFDLVVTVPALLVSLPVQAVVAAAVRIDLGSPVLFAQPRPGLHGETFTLRKFRTMRSPDPSRGRVSDADRLTPFGTLLRSTSLDELPTLWNIVRGDMSLVGPRPLLVQYLDRYSPEQARRHDVRPGLTGLAQVSGRNAVGWEQRFALDLAYVATHTIRGDIAILRRTVVAVLRRDGIAAEGDVTMPEFLGTPTSEAAP